ncbi:MAG: hypothetical protein U1E65_20350 [Myxococcota bacterium]
MSKSPSRPDPDPAKLPRKSEVHRGSVPPAKGKDQPPGWVVLDEAEFDMGNVTADIQAELARLNKLVR